MASGAEQRDHPRMGEGVTEGYVHVLACVECPRVSSVTARGWKAYRSDEPETGESPALAFYCPECATASLAGGAVGSRASSPTLSKRHRSRGASVHECPLTLVSTTNRASTR